METFKPAADTSLRANVINAIIEAIVTGALKAGDRVIEQRIAEQMGISRAPVREAIRDLEAHGIIAFKPRKGACVTPLSSGDIEGLYILRSRLEGLAARLATNRLNDEDMNKLSEFNHNMEKAILDNNSILFVENDLNFHDYICDKCDHLFLKKMIESVRLQTRMFMIMSKWHLVSHSQLKKEENAHQPILDAFKKKQMEQAEKCMREHIVNAGNLLTEYLKASEAEQDQKENSLEKSFLLKMLKNNGV